MSKGEYPVDPTGFAGRPASDARSTGGIAALDMPFSPDRSPDVSTCTCIARHRGRLAAILVSMTRMSRPTRARKAASTLRAAPRHWLLQDAKARFSELVRKVHSEGPQHVTVHGRDEVVVIAAEEFRRLQGQQTGRALIDALQASPDRDVDLAPSRSAMPVRGVVL
jgi:prevent-host-death family protein